jgi:hypothetical protein
VLPSNPEPIEISLTLSAVADDPFLFAAVRSNAPHYNLKLDELRL